MLRSWKAAVVLSGALLAGAWLAATRVAPVYAEESAPAPKRKADQAKEAPPDPSKKKAGEACKSSDECQKHHSCNQVGDKKVCEAPPRPRLPPGAVT